MKFPSAYLGRDPLLYDNIIRPQIQHYDYNCLFIVHTKDTLHLLLPFECYSFLFNSGLFYQRSRYHLLSETCWHAESSTLSPRSGIELLNVTLGNN